MWESVEKRKEKEELMKLRKFTRNELLAEKILAVKHTVSTFNAKQKEAPNAKMLMVHTSSTEINYSESAIGKATARARQHLSSLPRKRKAVIWRLYFLDSCQKSSSEESEAFLIAVNSHLSSIPAETDELVKDCLQINDIYRQTPGKRDAIIVKKNNVKYRFLSGISCNLLVKHSNYYKKIILNIKLNDVNLLNWDPNMRYWVIICLTMCVCINIMKTLLLLFLHRINLFQLFSFSIQMHFQKL